MPTDRFGRTCNTLEKDHIFPKAKGGSNSADNIQYLCRLSNEEKGDRTRGSINGLRFAVRPVGADQNGKTIGEMDVWRK